MNHSNILSVISVFLDMNSLLSFGLVNKAFNRVSKCPKAWRIHFFANYFGDLSIFG